jgi:glycosyltransferase involved in cell wall biosynthesis
VRIFHKEARALAAAGADAGVLALPRPARRGRRLALGWRMARAARALDADAYHVHDPELLPAALWLRAATGRPVIYDVHEYLGETARTKRWLPRPLRLPIALAAERLERAAASRLSAAVAVNEDLAARFAAAGAHAVSVTNFPWATAFPGGGAPAEPIALYVGGLGPLRGLEVMRAAWPLVSVPGARLLLAGPGDPGPLPPGAEHLGTVDHAQVPGLLTRAAVAWVPLQRHGNYDRAVPTKLVEAMAAGRPVVVSRLPSMATLGDAVTRVPPGSPAALGVAVAGLLDDPARWRAMAAAGRRAVEARFSEQAMAASYARLYAELCRRPLAAGAVAR